MIIGSEEVPSHKFVNEEEVSIFAWVVSRYHLLFIRR